MRSKISISELRDEIGKFKRFLLTTQEAVSPLRISASFDSAAVTLSPSMCVYLKGEHGQAAIRHIKTIHKVQETSCKYIFACLDYSSDDCPSEVVLQVDCFS